MFKNIIKLIPRTRLPVYRASSPIFVQNHIRNLSSTNILLAKKEKKGGKSASKGNKKKDIIEDDEPTEDINPKLILSELESKFKKNIEEFNKKIVEVKMGKANPDIFNKIKIKIDNKTTQLFTEVAQTTLKNGRFLTITVFDPNNVKKVISSILSSNLNMNPEIDPKNPQLLKVSLPTSTAEVKQKQTKLLKETMDQSKTSLNHLRGVVMKDLKKVTGSKDIVTALTKNIDKVYQSYSDELMTALKNAEKSLK